MRRNAGLLVAAGVWSVVLAASLISNLLIERRSVVDVAVAEARMISDALTQVSEGLMAGEVHTLREPGDGPVGHFTSLNPVSPRNQPDAWERKALLNFAIGATEASEVSDVAGQSRLRLMRPLTIEPRCLRCHAMQGYQVGDIRGGLSVAVPLPPAWSAHRAHVAWLGVIWLLGLGGIVLSVRALQWRTRERLEIERKFRGMAEQLVDVLFATDNEGRITYLSPSASPVFGCAPEEMLGRRFTEFVPEEEIPLATAYLNTVVGTGQSTKNVALRMTRRDGTVFFAEVNGSVVENEGLVMGTMGIIRDITERQKTEAQLLRVMKAVESASDAIGISDAQGHHFYQNQALSRLFEYATAEELGAAGGGAVAVKDPAVAKDMYDSIMGGGSWTGELQMITKSGRVFPAQERANAITDRDGKIVGLIGIITDITERKHAEEALRSSLREKEALLKEVHHRVKNNLQVISSLLRLECARSAQPDTKSVLVEMQGRLRSMALLHEALYRSGTFAAVDLGAYLQRLTTEIVRALVPLPGSVQLRLDLASVPVEMDQAMPCGLLVNELLSNSLEHGFPDGRTGEVRVELQPVDDGRVLRLCVSDTGVGLPTDFATRRGNALGLQLASDLAGQLGGILEIGPGPAAVFTVTFTAHVPKSSPNVL